jgi:hypothetical protein
MPCSPRFQSNGSSRSSKSVRSDTLQQADKVMRKIRQVRVGSSSLAAAYPHSSLGSSESAMGENRLSLRAATRAYSWSPARRGMGEKLPMQPRNLVDPPGRTVFQVTNRGLRGRRGGRVMDALEMIESAALFATCMRRQERTTRHPRHHQCKGEPACAQAELTERQSSNGRALVYTPLLSQCLVVGGSASYQSARADR